MNVIKRIFLLTLVGLTTLAHANSINSNFEAANKYYSDGNYQKAIEVYEELISTGSLSTDLYYNLGNAYYKTDKISSAILNYERALKLKPDNEDALFNLAMANKLTVDKIDRLPELFIGNTWHNLVTSRATDDWAFYCLIMIFVSLACFILYLLGGTVIVKKLGFYLGILIFSLSLFSYLLAFQHMKIIQNNSEAIIFSSSVTVKSEPNEGGEKLFTLHEGTKVKLLETSDGWNKIKLPNGNVGWLTSRSIVGI